MLCNKYQEYRSGNRCRLSRKNRVHTDRSAIDYHEFVEESEAPDSTNATLPDIVERLRDKGKHTSSVVTGTFASKALLNEAADEIERLRNERINLLGRIRRIACSHKGIGLPGCTVCDPIWQEHVDISLGASI